MSGDEMEQRLAALEAKQAQADERYKNIEEKLDKIIKSEERMYRIFVTREIFDITNDQMKIDIDNIGQKVRKMEDKKVSNMERVIFWFITGGGGIIFLINQLASKATTGK